MGCRISTASPIVAADAAPKKVVKLVKLDGKVLEFRAPILVKDVLLKFSGSADIGLPKHVASEHLPLHYELKLGKVYYMLPRFRYVSAESYIADSCTARRIKIVITKQQLHEILTNQVSLQKLLSDISASGSKTIPCHMANHSKNWKPKLQVIPEGVQQ